MSNMSHNTTSHNTQGAPRSAAARARWLLLGLPLAVAELSLTACATDTGFGAAHEVCSSPQALDFGEVTVRTEATRGLRITNCGGLPINEIEVRVVPPEGADPEDPLATPFSIAYSAIHLPIEVGDALELPVHFRPTELGRVEHDIELSFPTGSINDEPFHTPVTGTGVARDACHAAILETLADFGDVAVGEQGEATLTIENQGLTACELGGTRITAEVDSFSIIQPPEASLAPGARTTLIVAFNPRAPGSFDGSLALVASETDATAGARINDELSLPLHGEAFAVQTCELSYAPAVVVFPRATENATETTASFQLRNDGGLECSLFLVAISSGSDHFRITSAIPATVPAGETADIDLAFAPTAPGPLVGAVRVETLEGPVLDVPLNGFSDATPSCLVTFNPTPVAFDPVGAGLSRDEDVVIWNESVVDCELVGLSITPESGPDFALVTDPLPLGVLGPGYQVTVTVRFTPQSGALARGLLVADTGGAEPVTTELLGFGDVADLVLTPRETFFHYVTEGCASEAVDVMLTNIGTIAARVDSVEFSAFTDPNFELLSGIPSGTLVNPGQRLPITVRMLGAAGVYGGNSGHLVVRSTGSVRPATQSALFGTTESLADSARVDVFTQSSRPIADILFVVDNSGSMGEEQQNLAQNFASFISAFTAQSDVDFHLGITTTDVDSSAAGYLVGPVMDRNTPNLAQTFVQQANVGTNGSFDEQGLLASVLAVTPPRTDPFGPNSGFIRDEALLAIVWVSDEEDSSPGPVSNAINDILAIKGHRPDMVVGHAVAGDVPGGCPTADSGDRYLAAVTALGGLFASICLPDWAATLSQMGTNTVDRLTNFELTREPDPSSVVVLVTRTDGSVYEIPHYDPAGTPPQYNGWSIDEDSNTVIFHGNAVPEANERVEVYYNTKCLAP